jgi:hypothetical protein
LRISLTLGGGLLSTVESGALLRSCLAALDTNVFKRASKMEPAASRKKPLLADASTKKH